MAVSGHKTDAMLRRYRIIDVTKTAEALLQVDAYLASQPVDRNVASIERAQNAHNGAAERKRAQK